MSLTVVCLCADWCTTCQGYRAIFDQQAGQRPDDRFVWLDIEDHAEALGSLDIVNFPTILIRLPQGEVAFAGTVLPQGDALRRLCLAAENGTLQPPADLEASWFELAAHI